MGSRPVWLGDLGQVTSPVRALFFRRIAGSFPSPLFFSNHRLSSRAQGALIRTAVPRFPCSWVFWDEGLPMSCERYREATLTR